MKNDITRFDLSGDRDSLVPGVEFSETVRALWDKIRRRWMTVVGFVVIATSLALVYVQLATPVYTATAALLIDPRVAQNPGEGSDLAPGLLLSDSLTVESELRVLTSREVTRNTVRALGIDYQNPLPPSLRQRAYAWLGIVEQPPVPGVTLSPSFLEERRLEARRKAFVRGLRATRAGDSFVIDIAYQSTDLSFAPQAVNTLIREYLQASGQQRRDVVSRNSAWLSSRVDDLRQNLTEAELAVARFRRENDLLAPEGTQSPIEVALTQAVQQQVKAQANFLALDVQTRQLNEHIATGDLDAVRIPPEQRSALLLKYETGLADILQQEREALLIWESETPTSKRLRQQAEQTEQLIIGEILKVRDRLIATRDAALRQSDALSQVIEDLGEKYGEETEKRLVLASLEREATSKRALYERLLEQYNSATQLVSFDATSAQVIAWAVPPDTQSAPKSRQFVLLSAFAGAVFGSIALFLYEALDRSFRTERDMSLKIAAPFLGVFPLFGTDTGGGGVSLSRRSSRFRAEIELTRSLRRYSFAIRWPQTVAAQAFRGVLIAFGQTTRVTDNAPAAQVIGVCSARRAEGKTTTAFNLAALLSDQSQRVLLVDLDLSRRGLTRSIEKQLPKTNRLSAFFGDQELAYGALQPQPGLPNLTLLGNFGSKRLEALTVNDTEALVQLLSYLKLRFDVVVVDLPEVHRTEETPVLASLCDQILWVVRWGRTGQRQVMTALSRLDLPREKLLGLMFTRAHLGRYRSYNRDAF